MMKGNMVSFLVLVALSMLFIDHYALGFDDDEDDDEDDEGFAMLYLQNYHYLSPDEDLANQNTTKAIENFQKFFGIQVTGHLDEDTLYMMKKPRCGDPDVNIQGFRIKRYVTRGKWRKRNLTYYLSFGDDMSRADQSRIFAEAFKYWSDAAQNLTFNRTHDYNNTDLRISFGKRLHGGVPREKPCAYPFDGPGGIIAHAYYPSRGFIHFDDDEHFTELGGVQGWWWNSRQSRSLLYTAVHEIGHALGLAHSNVQGAVMWPLARNGRPVLHQDDIDGINSLYGNPKGTQTDKEEVET